MLHSKNVETVILIAEENTIVPDTQPELACVPALKRPHITFPADFIAEKGVKETHRN